MPINPSKVLFIINPGSGNNKTDWKKEIEDYFTDNPTSIELFELPKDCNIDRIKSTIKKSNAAKVIAVGGDGTVKLVAECIQNTDIALGILPGGSANGMARELGIQNDPAQALDVVMNGETKKIHLIKVNNEICIHLADIGFNAFVVKKFEDDNTRGMWGYLKAAVKVLWQNRRMQVAVATDNATVTRNAAMVVIANATKYGNGVVINPDGTLFDNKFEVVVIRKISFREIFKMRFTQQSFDPAKTEVFQTQSLSIQSKHRVHFQVDGETMGKVTKIEAAIEKDALSVIIPRKVEE